SGRVVLGRLCYMERPGKVRPCSVRGCATALRTLAAFRRGLSSKFQSERPRRRWAMAPSVRRPSCAQSPGSLQWYVVKVHSGREEAVKGVLERRVRLEALEEVVGRILIPVERVAEIRNGRRAERTRKLFSGYLLCELVLDDRVLAMFREIPGVS